MNKVLKNNEQKKNNTSDKKKNSNIKSSITDLLVSTAFSIKSDKTDKTDKINKKPNEVVDLLEDDYKSLLIPKNDTEKDDTSSKTYKSDKNNSLNNISSDNNRKSSIKSKKEKNLAQKNFSPNKNKIDKKSRDLNQIISILKSDYSSITNTYEKFNYNNFDSMSDDKRNSILNQLENTVFSSFQSLNQLSNLTNSNSEIKEALQEIFHIEDVTNQCAMYAYNIYSFIKMYQYKRNFAKKKNTASNFSLCFDSNSDNDNSKNNSRFNKKHFDSVKFARDAEIRRLDNKSSNSLSSTESLNLQALKQERSIMEGSKSNIRLDTLDKNRTQYLKEEIVNYKRILSGTVPSATSNSYNSMTNIASKGALSAKNSGKTLTNFSKFYD